MPIHKPTFPDLPVRDLTRHMDKLASLVEEAKKPDGSVDMRALEAKVRSAGDELLADAFDTVKGGFRTFTRSGGSSPVAVPRDPTRLEADDVRSVMGALIASKARLEGADQNRDGKIDKAEAERVSARGLDGKLSRRALTSATEGYLSEMRTWEDAVRKLSRSVNHRQALEGQVGIIANRHAETSLGAEAISWHLRGLAVAGRLASPKAADRLVASAESSFWKRIFDPRPDSPHLSDAEVKKLVGASDLAAFVADKRVAVNQAAGGSYDDWAAGKDLDGVDALQDPDFRPTPVGGSS